MVDAFGEISFLTRSENRVEVLSVLAGGTYTERELVTETGISDVTVGRILEDFAERGWIVTATDGGGYRASALGELLAEDYRRLEESMDLAALGAACNTPSQDTYTAGSIGPVAGEMAAGRVEDPDTGEAITVPGEKGELLWRGDTVMQGYYDSPEKDDEVFVERDGQTWLRSGDIGHRDERGHYFVDDRVDDMIITGGENVYPREIEDVVYELDGVVAAAVFGTPHERLGEQVTAAVVADEGVTAADIEAVCRDRLADYKSPRDVEFVDELPKTATRKIDKVALRDRFGHRTAADGSGA